MHKVNFIYEKISWDEAIHCNFRMTAGPFHQWEYVNLEAKRIEAKPIMILIENINGKPVAICLLIRKIDKYVDLCDATSVYGYNGILGLDGLTAAEQAEAVLILKQELNQLGCVSVYNRPYPPSPNITPGAKYVGDVLAINLTRGEEAYEAGLSSGHAYEIKKLKLAGVKVEIDAAINRLEEFHSIYLKTMSHRDAAGMYFFPLEYFRSLLDAKSTKAELHLALMDGVVAAGAIFLKSETEIFYHFSGSRSGITKYPATKLLIDAVVRSAIREGTRRFLHLGGGVGAKVDALFDFKRRFGCQTMPYCTDAWIIRPADYESLSSSMKSSTRPEFFPAYRA